VNHSHILYSEQRDKSEFGARDWIKKPISSSLAEDRMATALSRSRHPALSQFRPSCVIANHLVLSLNFLLTSTYRLIMKPSIDVLQRPVAFPFRIPSGAPIRHRPPLCTVPLHLGYLSSLSLYLRLRRK
jgi:hypothetical protein